MPAKLRFEDRNAVMAQIKNLGEEDLLFFNKLVVERLKLIAQAKSTSLMARFNIGDRVVFGGPAGGGSKAGVIVRINKTTASIQTDDGGSWNVFPGFLSLENSMAPDKNSGK